MNDTLDSAHLGRALGGQCFRVEPRKLLRGAVFSGHRGGGIFSRHGFYLTLWFPKDYLGRSIAGFQAANPALASGMAGAPIVDLKSRHIPVLVEASLDCDHGAG